MRLYSMYYSNKGDNIIAEQQRRVWGSSDFMPLLLLFAAIYVFIIIIVPSYLFLPMDVSGYSMMPTLHDGDTVWLFLQGDIDYGDIVVAYAPNLPKSSGGAGRGENIIKRVIGKPGDTIWFERRDDGGYRLYRQNADGITIIDCEPYIDSDKNITGTGYDRQYKLAEDEFFLMGDNRDNSTDSRNAQLVGYVNKKYIKGKVILILRGAMPILFSSPQYG